jgi:predicted DNA-binding transcriptional regulator YafY
MAVKASDVSFNEGVLRLAAIHNKQVVFRYAKGDGKIIESRTFIPGNISGKGADTRFTGYDPDRDEPRAYRIDRIKGEVRFA